jgi:hypothetical protein
VNEEDLKTTLTRVAHRASSGDDALERIARGHRRREVRRRTLTATGGVASLALLAVLAVQVLPGGNDDPTFGGDPSGSPTTAPNALTFTTDAIVYQERDGRLMFHRVDGERFEIESAAQARFASVVGYEEDVMFVTTADDGSSSQIWEWNAPDRPCPENATTCTGRGEAIATSGPIAGRVEAIAWGAKLWHAYLVRDASGEGPAELRIVDVQAEPVSQTLWTFPAWLGRGISSDDELRIEWSPDGRHLLVVNTFVDAAQERQDETLLVFDVETGQRVLTRHGTLARWEPDGKIVYSPLSGDDQRWRRMDLAGQEAILSVEGGTNPAVSPSGEWLAIERPDTSETVVLNLRREVETRTIRGAAPLWFDDVTILTTETEPCVPAECLEHPTVDTGRVHMECIAEVCDTADRSYPIATTRGAVATYAEPGLELVPAYPGS